MDLNENILLNIIFSIDPTRSVEHITNIRSLIKIADDVVTRALQADPNNQNLIAANNEVSRIYESISRVGISSNVEIVRMIEPAIYKSTRH